jgi:hypothetical protein
MNYNYFTGSELDVFDGKKGGLYLVGSCNFNPLTDEKYYWIKVGVAKTFKKRMASYKTHNPMLWKNSYFFCEDETQRYYLESKCHKMLNGKAIGSLSETSEWYEVDKDTYLDICNKGFVFFKEVALQRYALATLLAIKEKDNSTRTFFQNYAKQYKEIAALLS